LHHSTRINYGSWWVRLLALRMVGDIYQFMTCVVLCRA
jgi:hypothetical protein